MRKDILLKTAPLFFLSLFSNQAFAQNSENQKETIENKEFTLPDPTRYEAFYDIKTGLYYLYPKIGNLVVGEPLVMTPLQYSQYIQVKQAREYYNEKSDSRKALADKKKKEEKKKSILPSITINNKLFEKIFGGNKVELIPQGFATFDFGVLYQKIDNPMILPQNRTNTSINIQQRINVGILGKVGENLQLKVNYDTQSGFAFENKMNIVWAYLGAN